MNRLLIILAIAYAAGRILGSWSERRRLDEEAAAREEAPRWRFRIRYTNPLPMPTPRAGQQTTQGGIHVT